MLCQFDDQSEGRLTKYGKCSWQLFYATESSIREFLSDSDVMTDGCHESRLTKRWTPSTTSVEYKIFKSVSKFLDFLRFLRPVGRNFQRGVRRLASRIAHLAAGGQKQSSNFQALHSNFRKVLGFFQNWFLRFYTN